MDRAGEILRIEVDLGAFDDQFVEPPPAEPEDDPDDDPGGDATDEE